MPHICISELSSTCSGNGLTPVRRQAITWTNSDFLSIGPLGTNVSEIRSKKNTTLFIHENAFQNDVWEMAAIFFREMS